MFLVDLVVDVFINLLDDVFLNYYSFRVCNSYYNADCNVIFFDVCLTRIRIDLIFRMVCLVSKTCCGSTGTLFSVH